MTDHLLQREVSTNMAGPMNLEKALETADDAEGADDEVGGAWIPRPTPRHLWSSVSSVVA